jgi:excisionase family DNA binding protein
MTDEVLNLTTGKAAKLVGVHEDTIVRWANEGRLPSWRTPGGHRRFRRSDVLALLTADEPDRAAS